MPDFPKSRSPEDVERVLGCQPSVVEDLELEFNDLCMILVVGELNPISSVGVVRPCPVGLLVVPAEEFFVDLYIKRLTILTIKYQGG